MNEETLENIATQKEPSQLKELLNQTPAVEYKRLPGEEDFELPEVDPELNQLNNELDATLETDGVDGLVKMVESLTKEYGDDPELAEQVALLEKQLADFRGLTQSAQMFGEVVRLAKEDVRVPYSSDKNIGHLKKSEAAIFTSLIPKAIAVIVLPNSIQEPEDPRRFATQLPVRDHTVEIHTLKRLILHTYGQKPLARLGMLKSIFNSILMTARVKKRTVKEVREIDDSLFVLHNQIVEAYDALCVNRQEARRKKNRQRKMRKSRKKK